MDTIQSELFKFGIDVFDSLETMRFSEMQQFR